MKQDVESVNKNLEIRVKKEIEENKKQQQIIEQQSKMATMGEMIENIIHQWRQPLSVISTTASGVKFRHQRKVLEENDIEMSMDTIFNSVQHLSQIIDDFRNFFKTNHNKSEFLVKETFEKTLGLISSQFRHSNIRIIKNIENISLYGLEHELIQVLINILNNARDELIKKEQITKLIIIDCIAANDYINIYIKDNAGGIPQKLINKVFEPHFTTKEELNGTGIGLYMSKMIIEEHMGGTINSSNIKFIHENTFYTGALFKKICLN